MTEHRFLDQSLEQSAPIPPAGFVLLAAPGAADSCAAGSPVQWIYQQMYAQAVQAAQPRPAAVRDLFACMN